jgi:purine-nucleoside phosphorylase
VLATRLGVHDSVVVLGSGWSPVAAALGEVEGELALSELPGAATVRVRGHRGVARSVRLDDGSGRVLVLAGRVHLYEGHDEHAVVHLVRAAVLSGCGRVVLTNAAGSLRPDWPPGTLVAISDQLNLTGRNPMSGAAPPEDLPDRFVDLSHLYDPAWRAALARRRPGTPEGVYAGLPGGSYETPAEIRMLGRLGADLVGMSTVLEAIAARHLGAAVLGVSLVTNLAAGLQPTLDHGEVLAAGHDAVPALVGLLRDVLGTGPGHEA